MCLMLLLYRYFIGALRVVFFGELKERVLNLAAVSGISPRSVKLTEKGIEADISVKDFKRMRHILRKTGIRMHILRRYGLPFKISANRHRTGWIIGPIIFAAILKILTCRIWLIDVTGNQTVKTSEILSVCETLGIKEGVRKSRLNTALQKQQLLLKEDSLAWAALNIEGCRLTVNVSEITSPEEDGDCICNLTAAADGIIEKINITSGNCLVKTGDTVKEGDILVSGILEKPYATQYVHSSGSVIALTRRSITAEDKYTCEAELENGKTGKKYALELFSLKIPLYLGSEHKSHKSETKIKHLTLFGRELPIKLYKKSLRFTEKQTVRLTEAELRERLREKIKSRLEKENVSEFEIISEDFKETENGLSLTQLVSAEENIARRSALSVTAD